MFLVFLVVFGFFYFGIDAFLKLTGMEKFKLAKRLTYSALCAILAVSILTLIVVFF
jgi:hypothetical protein